MDSSEEPFKWGSPDLDALRGYVNVILIVIGSELRFLRFFQEELGWGQGKVDEILLPIIRKLNKRSQVCARVVNGDRFLLTARLHRRQR